MQLLLRCSYYLDAGLENACLGVLHRPILNTHAAAHVLVVAEGLALAAGPGRALALLGIGHRPYAQLGHVARGRGGGEGGEGGGRGGGREGGEGGAGTQVPGVEAGLTKPGLQTHVAALLGTADEARPLPCAGPSGLVGPARQRNTLPGCAVPEGHPSSSSGSSCRRMWSPEAGRGSCRRGDCLKKFQRPSVPEGRGEGPSQLVGM